MRVRSDTHSVRSTSAVILCFLFFFFSFSPSFSLFGVNPSEDSSFAEYGVYIPCIKEEENELLPTNGVSFGSAGRDEAATQIFLGNSATPYTKSLPAARVPGYRTADKE